MHTKTPTPALEQSCVVADCVPSGDVWGCGTFSSESNFCASAQLSGYTMGDVIPLILKQEAKHLSACTQYGVSSFGLKHAAFAYQLPCMSPPLVLNSALNKYRFGQEYFIDLCGSDSISMFSNVEPSTLSAYMRWASLRSRSLLGPRGS